MRGSAGFWCLRMQALQERAVGIKGGKRERAWATAPRASSRKLPANSGFKEGAGGRRLDTLQDAHINTHTRTHKIRAQSTQTNRDTEASSKASGERQPLPIIRESGAPPANAQHRRLAIEARGTVLAPLLRGQ